jgi:predicted ATPase
MVSNNLAQFEESEAVLAMARQCISLGEEQCLPYWIGWATFAQALSRLWAEDHDGAIALCDLSLQQLALTGSITNRGSIAGLRALALGRAGQFEAARQAAQEACDRAVQSGERQYLPQNQYVCGMVELLNPEGDDALAEQWFLAAIAECQVQGQHLDELRAATALARMWQTQGKAGAAHDLLAPIYGWFTEGLDTTLLKEAAALLAACSVEP